MSLKRRIKEHLIKKLNEGIDESGKPDLKYYAFDWDDNIVTMPTEIMLKSEDGTEIGMSTEDFADYRHKIGIEDFEYKNSTIIGFSEDPYRNFSVSGDKRFIIDSLIAMPGPSWNDFVECINGGSIFAIITARGHSPNVLRESVYNFILKNHNGIESQKLIENLKKYRNLSGEKLGNDIDLINDYLDMCKYHPVTYGEGSASNPEQGKIKAFREFIKYIKTLSNDLGKKAFLKNDIKNNFVPRLGFSDDDPGNIESMKGFIDKEKQKDVDISMYLTKGGEKSSA
jgi:hypothetical protein